MRRLIAALLILVYSNSVFATECPKPVVALAEGAAAPCKGFLVSPEKEKELRLLNEDYQLLIEKGQLTDKQVELYKANDALMQDIYKKEQEKTKLWQDQAEKYTQKYIAEQDSRSNRDWLFFIGGIVLTIGAGYALGQAAKASK